MFIVIGYVALNVNYIQSIYVTHDRKINCLYGKEKPYENFTLISNSDNTEKELQEELKEIVLQINRALLGIIPDVIPEKESANSSLDLVPEKLDATIAKWDAIIDQKTE